jgi:esterase/lipase superfamily enzyme
MPKQKSPTDSSYLTSSNLERISVWLSVSLTLVGIAGAAYVFISESPRGLSDAAITVMGVALVSSLFSLVSLQFRAYFDRRSMREPLGALLVRVEQFVSQQNLFEARIAANAEKSAIQALQAARYAVSEELIQSIVEKVVNRQFEKSRESSTDRLAVAQENRGATGGGVVGNWPPPEQDLDLLLPPAFSDDDSHNRTMVGADTPIAKLKGLLEDLKDRDDVAMRASLALTNMIIRGQPTKPCEYRVWFGTDRRLKVDGDFSQGFKEEFSDELRCGSCVVYVPISHEFASLGSGPIARIFKKISGKPADAPLKLLAIEAGTPESFVNDLRASLRELPESERDLVLFVHGYNVDFNSAALRAAQIGRDLELPGPMLFYSWPSKANLPGYWADEATIDRTLPKFVAFLELLIAIPELSAVNIIAHSMGNRLFQRAMQLFAFRQQATDKRFGHVILAAPDIDRETFRQAADDYARVKASAQRRTAVYFNKNDVAVNMSCWIHQEARAGTQGGAFANTDSILWIDSFFRLDWLGHGYFATAAPVLKDMKELLLENKTPAQRQPPLTPVPSDVPQYWELRA